MFKAEYWTSFLRLFQVLIAHNSFQLKSPEADVQSRVFRPCGGGRISLSRLILIETQGVVSHMKIKGWAPIYSKIHYTFKWFLSSTLFCGYAIILADDEVRSPETAELILQVIMLGGCSVVLQFFSTLI